MVLVSHEHKFVFLKTRKTAGTSIEMLLEPLCMPEGHVVIEKTKAYHCEHGIVGSRLLGKKSAKSSVWRSHMPAHLVYEELSKEQWQHYFRFSCLRNPFDKAISQFFWGRDARSEPTFDSIEDARPEFRNFVLGGGIHSDKSVTHRKGKFILNGFLRFERLTVDIERLSEKLNLPINSIDLVHAKGKTSRLRDVPISAYYDPDTIQSVREQMAWVFEQGKYSLDPIDADNRIVPPRQKWSSLKRRSQYYKR